MRQVGRTLIAADQGLMVGHRVLICDRNAKWSAPVRRLLSDSGIRVVQTPYRAPNANTYAERFVRSIRDECLDQVMPFGERHLRRTLAEFVDYHRERNHQGLGNELVDRAPPLQRVGGIRVASVSVDSSIITTARPDPTGRPAPTVSAVFWDITGLGTTTRPSEP